MSHCWADYGQWIEATYGYLSDRYLEHAVAAYNGNEVDFTCMLPGGHSGPHVWTPSDQIVIRFATE